MLKVQGLSSGYGRVEIVKNIDLQVEAGEIVALVGANGAGKSTFINTVCGLVKARCGSVYFLDQDITAMPAHEIVNKGLIQMPEGRQLFPEMSVEENLLLGATNPEGRQVKAETLEYVYRIFPRLLERKRQISKTLSGGEQQMIAVGRALMSKPKLLICDEISLGLAPIVVTEMFGVIQELNRSGLTILLIEQNVKRALALSHRAYVMENGRIVLAGSSADLRDHPHVKNAYLGI